MKYSDINSSTNESIASSCVTCNESASLASFIFLTWFYDASKLTYLLARPESRIHSFPPYLAVAHHGCQLPSCCCASVSLQLFDICCSWSSSAPLPVCGFPEDETVCTKFRMSLTVSRQSQSSGSNFVTECWQWSIKYHICNYVTPANIEGFSQHSCL